MTEPFQDQAVEYALGLLSGEERTKVAQELDRDPALRKLMARIAWNPAAKQGRLWTSDLPQLAADKPYQLWVFDSGNPQPISAGIFEPGLSNEIPLRSTQPIGSAAKFAVTIEQRGGVPISAGPVVLVSGIES